MFPVARRSQSPSPRSIRFKDANQPRVALLCPACVESGEPFGHLTRFMNNLRVVRSLRELFTLVSEAPITHVFILTKGASPESERWVDAIIEYRTRNNGTFAIVSMDEEKPSQFLPG